MRQIYLQSRFYHLAKMPVIHASEEAKQRERALTIWETLCQQGMNREEASKVVGCREPACIAGDMGYNWKAGKGWRSAVVDQSGLGSRVGVMN